MAPNNTESKTGTGPIKLTIAGQRYVGTSLQRGQLLLFTLLILFVLRLLNKSINQSVSVCIALFVQISANQIALQMTN